MPEFQRLLARYQRRFRSVAVTSAVIVGAAAGGLVFVLLSVTLASPGLASLISAAAGLLCGGVTARISWRQWTLARVAVSIEAQVRCDNLVITGEEVVNPRRPRLHPILQAELLRQAIDRLELTSPAQVRPLGRTYAMAGGAVVAFLVLLLSNSTLVRQSTIDAGSPEAAAPLRDGDLRVLITPPSYTQRPAVGAVNPTAVVAIEGSRVRLEAAASGRSVRLLDTSLDATPFAADGDRFVYEFTAARSRALVVQYHGGAAPYDRLVQLRVEADRRPSVRLTQPAKDLIFGEPIGDVPLEIEARDDIALKTLTLRYTRVAGSGETFTFEEGDLPVQIARGEAGAWTARGVLTLQALKLQDGDTLVYRAVASDYKPGADPSVSDSFVIEVGRTAGVASSGFALPADRERQAISQQMLIIKTERLHNARGRMSQEEFAEQARMLAIEQRMVKAEFVFMTGGEVADEIAEAEHSHELAEGRLENAGQVELLVAIREMSRAEARLNDADTARGLEFERAALKALQRAFDRRRYLLRTLPERARIDATRRLTGELADARSSTQKAAPVDPDPILLRAREALTAVSEWAGGGPEPSALVAARLMAVEPSSEPMQQAALRVSGARDVSERQRAAQSAQLLLVGIIRSRAFHGGTGRLPQQPWRGRIADELSGRVMR